MTITVHGSRIGVASATLDWWDGQWPIVMGCTKISAGCTHCAASILMGRDPTLQKFAYTVNGDPHRAKWTGLVESYPEMLDQALVWAGQENGSSLRIFVSPAADLFHDQVPDSFLDATFETLSRAAPVTFGILTKRPERMREYLRGRSIPDHIWIGVTVESGDYLSRVDDLLTIDAKTRWVSAEPLLGAFSLAPWLGPDRLNWVVCGPELGEYARPCQPSWMRTLRSECIDAGVPFFTKHLLDGEEIREYPHG